MAGGGGVGRVAEARVLRRTRLKLVGWSAGSTLVVLVAMGGVLYAATAQLLAADSEAMLRQRATFLTTDIAYATVGTVSTVDHAPPPVVTVQPPSGNAPDSTTVGDLMIGPSSGGGTLADPVAVPAPVSFPVVSDPGAAGMRVGGPVSGTIAVALP